MRRPFGLWVGVVVTAVLVAGCAGTKVTRVDPEETIDLSGYCRAMVAGGYSGPACLEVIGVRDLSLPEVSMIASESYGYLNACLKACGGR